MMALTLENFCQYIAQSTKFPCANNTITVKFENIFNIHKNCDPRVTVSGLYNTRTSDSALRVEDLHNGGFHLGTWNQTKGQLVLDLADFIAVGQWTTAKSFARVFEFRFQIVNPSREQDCVAPNITIEMIPDIPHLTESNTFRLSPPLFAGGLALGHVQGYTDVSDCNAQCEDPCAKSCVYAHSDSVESLRACLNGCYAAEGDLDMSKANTLMCPLFVQRVNFTLAEIRPIGFGPRRLHCRGSVDYRKKLCKSI